jgi:uncharacterized protein YjiS (DUF1127 family)
MTAIALALKETAPRMKAFARYIANVFTGVAEGHEIARRYEELSRMSDEALAARGITREELPQAIVTGRICR